MNDFDKAKQYLKTIVIIVTAAILFVTAAIVIIVNFILNGSSVISEGAMEWIDLAIIFSVSALLIGSALSFLGGKLILMPVDVLLDGMEQLSNGKYDTRIDFGKNKSMKSVSDGFNALASELEHTEIMRSDFINNFSHEFKTPLASAKGLISLMKSGRVPPEKQREYLKIIDEEADRLSMMTTNVLNLSKIQNQSIIIDKEEFNLSEQIRSTLVLFEKRWTERSLSLSIEMDESRIFASEDMLKQVWLNLIDNAIKFSNDASTVKITLTDEGESITVSVTNSGEEISDENIEKIFRKFYQSHSTNSRSGNGIGLSIVKSIVEMHGGKISVVSKDGENTFAVTLPKE